MGQASRKLGWAYLCGPKSLVESEPKARISEPEPSTRRSLRAPAAARPQHHRDVEAARRVVLRGILLPSHSRRRGLLCRSPQPPTVWWVVRTEGKHPRAQGWIWRGVADKSEGRASRLCGWEGWLSRRRWPDGRFRLRLWLTRSCQNHTWWVPSLTRTLRVLSVLLWNAISSGLGGLLRMEAKKLS